MLNICHHCNKVGIELYEINIERVGHCECEYCEEVRLCQECLNKLKKLLHNFIFP